MRAARNGVPVAVASPAPEDRGVARSRRRWWDCGSRQRPPRAAGVEVVTCSLADGWGLASELTNRAASTKDVMPAGSWSTSRMVAHHSAGCDRGAPGRGAVGPGLVNRTPGYRTLDNGGCARIRSPWKRRRARGPPSGAALPRGFGRDLTPGGRLQGRGRKTMTNDELAIQRSDIRDGVETPLPDVQIEEQPQVRPTYQPVAKVDRSEST